MQVTLRSALQYGADNRLLANYLYRMLSKKTLRVYRITKNKSKRSNKHKSGTVVKVFLCLKNAFPSNRLNDKCNAEKNEFALFCFIFSYFYLFLKYMFKVSTFYIQTSFIFS